jgi:hypothetical protein
MKYLEQRVEELELEIKLLKAKNKLNDTSSYLNNYPPYNDPNKEDYMYNDPNITLFSESKLESSNNHFWDYSELEKNPLDTITENLSSIEDDNFPNTDYVIFSDLPEYYPPYPNILSSWDNCENDILQSEKGIKLKTYLEKKIEEKYGKVISKFPVHRHEWEMDGYGYIVENKNGRNIILTDHGNPYTSNINELESLVASYKDVIQKTERAMFLLK